MRLPALRSVIRRRLLVNFRVDPAEIERLLPAPFRPQLVKGHAIAGVCMIHLEQVRPAFLGSLPLGIDSQNAAHRIAVEWNDDQSALRRGVFITRRDTASRLVSLTGGRLFPGIHHRARFDVREDQRSLELSMASDDGLEIRLRGEDADSLPAGSCFSSLAESSAFFEAGALGYSPARKPGTVEGFRLETPEWRVAPFALDEVHASFFQDAARFRPGSVTFDHALVMRDTACYWRMAPDLVDQQMA